SLLKIDKELNNGANLDTLLEEHYPQLEKISVDYAIIEKASNVIMIESDFDWDDVGEWPAVARHYPADNEGNVVRGAACLQSSSENIVFSRDPDHLVALLGVEDLIVVKTDDATLLCHKDKAQNLKDLVQSIGAQERYSHLM
ncbi:MAG: mannose-1-phosphate guanyltransferase, partial [Verrucomicrobiota bacterium]|nr:mannose-1-phosphate guanyltransferase [Verrucomicrobiota bacterium]